jgi:hypothetical protein
VTFFLAALSDGWLSGWLASPVVSWSSSITPNKDEAAAERKRADRRKCVDSPRP